MHVLFGFVIVAVSFVFAFRYADTEFSGFWNLSSVILLVGVPWGLALATHPFSSIASGLRGIFFAITRNLTSEEKRAKNRIRALARAVRAGRGQEALAALSGSKDGVLLAIGERVVRKASAQEVEQDGVVLARAELAHYQAADRLFGDLGEYAPGVGMIGTLIGLVQLLANMRDLERLGPAMALALLTTFYGLILAHALYLPLAKLAASQGARRAATVNLTLSALRKVAERRPLYEVDQLLGVASDASGDGERREAVTS